MAVLTLEPPNTNIHTTGRTMVYIVQSSATTVMCRASVLLIGAHGPKTVQVKRTFHQSNAFVFDLSGVCKDYFRNYNNTFDPVGGSLSANTDRILAVSAVFTDWELVGNKVVENTLTTATSSVRLVINAALEHPIEQLSTDQESGRVFFTNKPRGIICEGDTEYLSIFSGSGAGLAAVVTYYDENGSIGSVSLPMPAGFASVNVGPSNPFLVYPSGTKYLTVRTNVSPADYHLKYIYKPKCCHQARLHFVNPFMSVDSMSFQRLFIKPKTKSQSFWRTLPNSGLQASDIGKSRYNISFQNEYQASAENLSLQEVRWLDDLLRSNQAMWEVDGINYPIRILDSSSNEYDTRGKLFEFSVKFELSNPKPSLL